MNLFFDISESDNLPDGALELNNLGSQRIMAMISNPRRNDFGQRSYESKNYYTKTLPTDYDNQFINKLINWQPIYGIERVINHHYKIYSSKQPQGHDSFIKHMKYYILPLLQKQRNSDACIELFKEWLENKSSNSNSKAPHTINNTINLGTINAPLQFQQNSNNSVQNQHNHYKREEVKELFELLKKDIEKLDEKIRSDFALEMDYAMVQLEKRKDITPQLLTIGELVKDVGIGVFTNILASPLSEELKHLINM